MTLHNKTCTAYRDWPQQYRESALTIFEPSGLVDPTERERRGCWSKAKGRKEKKKELRKHLLNLEILMRGLGLELYGLERAVVGVGSCCAASFIRSALKFC